MREYPYKMLTREGKTKVGKIQGENAKDALKRLQQENRGYYYTAQIQDVYTEPKTLEQMDAEKQAEKAQRDEHREERREEQRRRRR